MSISYSQFDPSANDSRSADAPLIEPSEVRSQCERTELEELTAEPADPPPASPTPLRGQVETNQPIAAEEAANADCTADAEQAFQDVIARRFPAAESGAADLTAHRAAFDLGWQSYLQRGRQQATPTVAFETVTFENVEPELAQLWRLKEALHPQRLPWEEAKETARDAWDRVRDALTGG